MKPQEIATVLPEDTVGPGVLDGIHYTTADAIAETISTNSN